MHLSPPSAKISSLIFQCSATDDVVGADSISAKLSEQEHTGSSSATLWCLFRQIGACQFWQVLSGKGNIKWFCGPILSVGPFMPLERVFCFMAVANVTILANAAWSLMLQVAWDQVCLITDTRCPLPIIRLVGVWRKVGGGKGLRWVEWKGEGGRLVPRRGWARRWQYPLNPIPLPGPNLSLLIWHTIAGTSLSWCSLMYLTGLSWGPKERENYAHQSERLGGRAV